MVFCISKMESCVEILVVFPHLLPFLLSGWCCFHPCISVSFQQCYTHLRVVTTAALETPYTKDELHWRAMLTALVVLSSSAPRMERDFSAWIRKSLTKQIGSAAYPRVTEQEAATGALQWGFPCRESPPSSSSQAQTATDCCSRTAADGRLHSKVKEPGESITGGRNSGTCQRELC